MHKLYIIGGPNGAGKTTVAFKIFPTVLNCIDFVNADLIALGLSPFNPSQVDITAGRIMLKRLNELIEDRKSFAFETTLASKTFKKLIEKAHASLLNIYLAELS